MSLDSEACFAERMEEVGLGAYAGTFKARGWTTFAKFAYSCAYVPGSGMDETGFIREVAEPILGSLLGVSTNRQDLPSVRRLYFEAFTLSAAEMRRIKKRTWDSQNEVIY